MTSTVAALLCPSASRVLVQTWAALWTGVTWHIICRSNSNKRIIQQQQRQTCRNDGREYREFLFRVKKNEVKSENVTSTSILSPYSTVFIQTQGNNRQPVVAHEAAFINAVWWNYARLKQTLNIHTNGHGGKPIQGWGDKQSHDLRSQKRFVIYTSTQDYTYLNLKKMFLSQLVKINISHF